MNRSRKLNCGLSPFSLTGRRGAADAADDGFTVGGIRLVVRRADEFDIFRDAPSEPEEDAEYEISSSFCFGCCRGIFPDVAFGTAFQYVRLGSLSQLGFGAWGFYSHVASSRTACV